MLRPMKGRKLLIRLHEREVDEKRKQLAELDRLLDSLKAQANSLEAELLREQANAGGDPNALMTYDAYAIAVIERRKNLAATIADVELRVGRARDELADAFRELKKYEIAEANYQRRKARDELRVEQITLDDVAIEGFRRKSSG